MILALTPTRSAFNLSCLNRPKIASNLAKTPKARYGAPNPAPLSPQTGNAAAELKAAIAIPPTRVQSREQHRPEGQNVRAQRERQSHADVQDCGWVPEAGNTSGREVSDEQGDDGADDDDNEHTKWDRDIRRQPHVTG